MQPLYFNICNSVIYKLIYLHNKYVSTQLYLFIIIFIHFYSIMIYTKYTPQYQLAARQLINQSFAKNSPIPGIVQVTDQQVYKYRSQYIKFDNIVGLMVLEPITKKLIGVGFTEDFFDFVQGVNQKITYSQGFEFMRQKIFKVIVDDYLKKYPTLKRGIIGYNYSASVDIQYKNQKILANLTLETCHFNKKLGYNKTLFLSVDERVLNAFMNFGPLVALKPKITYYPPKNQILRGKLLNIGAWCIQVDLYTQFYPKL